LYLSFKPLRVAVSVTQVQQPNFFNFTQVVRAQKSLHILQTEMCAHQSVFHNRVKGSGCYVRIEYIFGIVALDHNVREPRKLIPNIGSIRGVKEFISVLISQEKTKRLLSVMLNFERQHSPRVEFELLFCPGVYYAVAFDFQGSRSANAHITVYASLNHIFHRFGVILVFMAYQAPGNFRHLESEFPPNIPIWYSALQEEWGTAIAYAIAVPLAPGSERGNFDH